MGGKKKGGEKKTNWEQPQRATDKSTKAVDCLEKKKEKALHVNKKKRPGGGGGGIRARKGVK